MNWTRRETLKAAAMIASTSYAGNTFPQTKCLPGMVVTKVEVKREYVYIEGEFSVPRRLGPTVKAKIPVSVLTSVVVCEAAPPSPPPPPPPKDDGKPKHGWNPGGNGGFAGAWFLADAEGFAGFLSGLSVRTRLPAFTRLSSGVGRLTTVVGLADGTSATLQNTLSFNGAEFRVSDVSKAAPFVQTYGQQIVTLQQQVSDIEIEATGDGADTLGLDTHYFGNTMLQTDRLLHVSSRGSPPPIFTDPQAGPPSGR